MMGDAAEWNGRQKGLLFLYVFLDVLGFSLVLPLLPFLVRELDEPTFGHGVLFSSNALAQFLAAPVIGHLSDVLGRRPLLLACLLATFASFAWLSVAASWWAVLGSRLLDGLLGGNVGLAQAYIADVTSPEQRTAGMGIVGAAFGAGFTIGPALGGMSIALFGARFPAMAAAVVALLNVLLVARYLPESLPPHRRRPAVGAASSLLAVVAQPARDLLAAARSQQLWALAAAKFALGAALVLFETSFGVAAAARFDLAPQHCSYLLSLVGVFFSAAQGLGARVRRCHADDERRLSAAGFVLLAAAFAAVCLAPTTLWFAVAVVPMAVALGALNTLLSSLMSKSPAAQHRAGEVMGLAASIGSLTRIVAPLVATAAAGACGPSGPFAVAAGVALAAAVLTRGF